MTERELLSSYEEELLQARHDFEDIKAEACQKAKLLYQTYAAGNVDLARKLGWELANLGSEVYNARGRVESATITARGFRERMGKA